MSDQSLFPATNLPAGFTSKFTFAALTFGPSDVRRKAITKYTRAGFPTDVAATTTVIARDDVNSTPLRDVRDRTNPVGDTLRVIPRVRVIVGLIEPNVLDMARGYTRTGPRPDTTQAEDGVYEATWATLADHAAATSAVGDHYLHIHELTEALASGQARLDTWHDPFLLIPVRHHYTDGSPSVTRWMCADGNARLIGHRIALAHDLTTWDVDHPYADPRTLWPVDMATVRTAVAAARTGLMARSEDEQEAMAWPVAVPIEQWADLMIPAPDRALSEVGMWLYHEHNSRPDDDTDEPTLSGRGHDEPTTVPVSALVTEWLDTLDHFKGLDADALEDILDADVTTRAGRRALAQAEAEVDQFLRGVSVSKDQTAARLTLAACALHTSTDFDALIDSGDLTLPVPPVWEDEEFVEADWYRIGLVFSDYVRRVTRKNQMPSSGLDRELNAVRAAVTAHRVFPTCDLYGVWQDLHHQIGEGEKSPMTDPASDWFTVTAIWGLSYATLFGHLTFRDLDMGDPHDDDPDEDVSDGAGGSVPEEAMARAALYTGAPTLVTTLLSTTVGQDVVVYYARCASAGVVPENRVEAMLPTLLAQVKGVVSRLEALGVSPS